MAPNKQLVWWLERWGEWYMADCRGLGYPAMTPEARLYTSPGKASMIKPLDPDYRQDNVARRVDIALHELPERQWQLLALRYALKCSYAEIATQLSLGGRSTAFNQVTKAHKPVAEQLKIPCYR